MNVEARPGLAGLVRVNPAIFDAGQSPAIEVDGAFRAFALAEHPCVEDGDDEKNYESSHHAENASR